MTPPIKLLALMEATTVTGPAKLLIEFCRLAREADSTLAGLPRVEASVVTFRRGRAGAAESRNGASMRSREDAPNEFVTAARAAGVEVDVIGERFRFDPSVVGQLRRVVERRAPDIIETHMIKSHFLTLASGLARRHRWVAYHHGYTTTDAKMRLYNQLNRLTLPRASRVITVCGPFARGLASAGVSPEKISVVHSSVAAACAPSASDVGVLKTKLGVTEGERVVLAVGRLSREKGHVGLVHALEHLRRVAPATKFKLVIVGDGPERERVEAAASSSGLGASVVFAGHASDVRPFYALADVLALPSHSEGSPLVLLEAMAACVPVVATSVGGVPEVASDGETALLVPPHDPAAFAYALARVLADASLARTLSSKAAAHVAERFSPEARARALVEIYGALVSCEAERLSPQPVNVQLDSSTPNRTR
jgi:glycosyltransferase involved in cell wall biosynthesis